MMMQRQLILMQAIDGIQQKTSYKMIIKYVHLSSVQEKSEFIGKDVASYLANL